MNKSDYNSIPEEELKGAIKIFHGGCPGCIQQIEKGLSFCRTCQNYSDENGDKPNWRGGIDKCFTKDDIEIISIRNEVQRLSSRVNKFFKK